jgi:3-deoxy-7-phosphoheptulonate synthase
VVNEVTMVEDIDQVVEYADMFQIGVQNMSNFGLLKEVDKCSKPALLKCGLAATIEEWLNAAEYIMNAGYPNVVFCKCGIRTYET